MVFLWFFPHRIAQCPGTHGGLELRLGEVGDQRWALTRGGLGGPHRRPGDLMDGPHMDGLISWKTPSINKWTIKFGG